MPVSKVRHDRAKKLKKRENEKNQSVSEKRPRVTYAYMLDVLRESLNNRFFEEQGFPHLEVLAQNMKVDSVTKQDLTDYMQLQDLLIGMSYTLARALSPATKLSMIEREDHVAGVAYALAATLLDKRPDFKDVSGWMGNGVIAAIRENWARAKFQQAGIPRQVAFLGSRDLCCLFAVDFVMSFLDMTGEIENYGADRLVSVTSCKDVIITAYTGYLSHDPNFVQKSLVDFRKVLEDNTVDEEFLLHYKNWTPETADAFDMNRVGFNMIEDADTEFMARLINNPEFMSDVRTLYLGETAASFPQGKREEIVMGYVLRYGPRCKRAFDAGRDPSEEEMNDDAAVVNALIMQVTAVAQAS